MSSFVFISSCVAAGTFLAASVLVTTSQRKWREETDSEFAELFEDIENVPPPNQSDAVSKSINSVPPPIYRHLQKVLLSSPSKGISPKRIKSLRIKQEGEFLLNGQWIAFTATQAFSASNSNPGFVWEANMKLPLPSVFGWLFRPISINVKDAYIRGKGTMVGKLLGLITVVDMCDTPELNQGELMRWMGECLLYPTALLRASTESTDGHLSLTWNRTSDEDSATAILEDSRSSKNDKIQCEIEFISNKDDNLIGKIYALRPFGSGNDDEEVKIMPWEGHLSQYEEHDGILIPTRMEVGWWKDPSNLELYFKGRNTAFEFSFF